MHSHRWPSILIVREGEVIERSRTLDAGAIVSHEARFQHDIRGSGSFFTISVGSRFARYIRDQVIGPSPATASLVARIQSDLQGNGAIRDVSLRATLLRLVAVVSREHTSRDHLVEQARRYVETHYAAPIEIETIARELRIHPAQLCRRYKRAFGTTVGEAIRACRLAHASKLLSTTSLSMRDVAGASGFFDASHLIRSWQTAYGRSPAEFKETHERVR